MSSASPSPPPSPSPSSRPDLSVDVSAVVADPATTTSTETTNGKTSKEQTPRPATSAGKASNTNGNRPRMAADGLSIRERKDSEAHSRREASSSSVALAASQPVHGKDEQRAAEAPMDPREPLDDVDWSDFEHRFEQRMDQANAHEAEILREFQQLTEFFGRWAQTASAQDNDRAFKRLKTREMFVQRAEESLEAKKQHYIQVVDAFQKALALLGGA